MKIILSTLLMLALMSTASASCNNMNHHKAPHYSQFEAITDYQFSEHYFSEEINNIVKEIRLNHNWRFGVISDSANFENSNEAIAYQLTSDGRVLIYDETGAIGFATVDQLSKYSVHLYPDNNHIIIKLDGSMNDNLKEIMNV